MNNQDGGHQLLSEMSSLPPDDSFVIYEELPCHARYKNTLTHIQFQADTKNCVCLVFSHQKGPPGPIRDDLGQGV